MKRVYVIDDDPILQKIMQKMISGYNSEFEVTAYEDGQMAINGLIKTQNMPDLIFLDINMPKMDAWEFIEAYQKQNFGDIPIYILSSSIDQRDIDRANSIDLIRKYLVKPMKKQELYDIFEIELPITD